MCVNCGNDGIGRRDFMKVAAAGAMALGIGGAPPVARAEEGAPTALSPGEALAALKSGNERYVRQSGALHGPSRGKPHGCRRASGALGDNHLLRRQPRAS